MYFFKKNFLYFLLILCLLVLFVAYYIEYILGHQPCKLCLIERIPYIITILAILFVLKFKDYEKKVYILISILFLISIIISLYHLGIELNIFEETIFCSVDNQGKILSKEELLNLLNKPAISCKNVTFKLFGLSLTSYNILLSLIILLNSIKFYREYEKN